MHTDINHLHTNIDNMTMHKQLNSDSNHVDTHSSTIASYLRLTSAILSVIAAVCTRRYMAIEIPYIVGSSWTISMVAFIVSIVQEMSLSRFKGKIAYIPYLIGAVLLLIGSVFLIGDPGVENIMTSNVWMAGGLVTMLGQISLAVQMTEKGISTRVLRAACVLGACGSLMYFVAGMFISNIDDYDSVSSGLYDSVMKASNLWISGAVLYVCHALLFTIGLMEEEANEEENGDEALEEIA